MPWFFTRNLRARALLSGNLLRFLHTHVTVVWFFTRPITWFGETTHCFKAPTGETPISNLPTMPWTHGRRKRTVDQYARCTYHRAQAREVNVDQTTPLSFFEKITYWLLSPALIAPSARSGKVWWRSYTKMLTSINEDTWQDVDESGCSHSTTTGCDRMNASSLRGMNHTAYRRRVHLIPFFGNEFERAKNLAAATAPWKKLFRKSMETPKREQRNTKHISVMHHYTLE